MAILILKKQYEENELLVELLHRGAYHLTENNTEETEISLEFFLIEHGKNGFASELTQGIKTLVESVKEALEFVLEYSELFKAGTDHPRISTVEVAYLLEKVAEALMIFEDVVFVFEGLLSSKKLRQLEDYEDWQKTLEKMYWDISNPKHFSRWSHLSLIDEYYQLRQKPILPIFHNRFPWLENGSGRLLKKSF